MLVENTISVSHETPRNKTSALDKLAEGNGRKLFTDKANSTFITQ